MTERTDIETFIDRLFVEGDDVATVDAMAAADALRADDDARAYYDEVARLDAALGGDLERRFGEALFLGRLDAMLAEERQASGAVPVAANTNRPIGALVAVAALVMFGLAPVLFETSQPRDELQARSAVAPPSSFQTPEFEVFCVDRDEGSVVFAGPTEFEFGTVRCRRDQEIKLAARSPDPRLHYAAFFGIAADATLYWYGPSPAVSEPFEVKPASRIAPIGETIRLGTNHEPGPVRIVGMFTERPLDFEDIEVLVRRNAMNLRDGDFEIPDGVVVRKTFEVTP